MQALASDKNNILYLYDLPKDVVTSVKICKVFEEAGVVINTKPQIKIIEARPFATAMVKIDNPADFEKAKDKLRYFEIDGKPCRALPFDRDLLGEGKKRIVDQNVFVQKIPKNTSLQELEEHFK
jgi:hypothetical protein